MREERASRGERGRRNSIQSSIVSSTISSELILGGLDLDLLVGDRPGAELGRRRRVGAPRAPAVEREPASGSQLSAGMSLSSLATPSSPSRISRSVPSSSPSTARLGPVWPPRGAGTRPRPPPPRVSCSPTAHAHVRPSSRWYCGGCQDLRVTNASAFTSTSIHRTACDGSVMPSSTTSAPGSEWTRR